MKRHVLILMPLLLAGMLRAVADPGPVAEPGPEQAGVRLRLLVAPNAGGGSEGYDVQLDLIGVSQKPVLLRTNWKTEREQGGFIDFVEEAASIESYPALEPWLGQVMQGLPRTTPEPEHTLQPGESLSVKWHATGRRLKNKVSNPLEVQNPEFREKGLHSVHATLVLGVGDQTVLLRSNEQLVAIGGSRDLPKHTYGPLWATMEEQKSAMLGLGSLHKIVPGDQFLIQSGTIGRTWTLTITKAEPRQSFGTLVPSTTTPVLEFPRWGQHATLIPRK